MGAPSSTPIHQLVAVLSSHFVITGGTSVVAFRLDNPFRWPL